MEQQQLPDIVDCARAKLQRKQSFLVARNPDDVKTKKAAMAAFS